MHLGNALRLGTDEDNAAAAMVIELRNRAKKRLSRWLGAETCNGGYRGRALPTFAATAQYNHRAEEVTRFRLPKDWYFVVGHVLRV